MMISYRQLQSIKRMNLAQLVIESGIQLKSNGNGTYRGLCPFHADHLPSFNVTQKPNGVWLWHCFGCSAKGTAIDFVMKKEHLSLPRAYTKLVEKVSQYSTDIPQDEERPQESSLASSNPSTHTPSDKTISSQELLNQVVRFYHNCLKEDLRGIEYLKQRGLVDKEMFNHFKVGFVNGSIKRLLPQDGEVLDQLKDLGILNEKGNEIFYNCVVFPIFDENDQPVGLYGRNIERPAHLYLKGPHRGIFNWQAAKAYNEIILTESIIDSLSLYQAGLRNTIPCYGTNGFTQLHIDLLKKHTVKKVYLALDNDVSGDKAAKGNAQLLNSIGIEPRRVHLPEGIKDLNQYFNYTEELDFKGTKESFERLIQEAKRIGYSISQPKTTEERPFAYQDGRALFHFGELEYDVRGIYFEDLNHLRVITTIQKDSLKHTDRFDLYTARSRKAFSNLAAHKLKLQPARIEDDLLDIISSLEELKAEELAKKRLQEQTQDNHYQMSEEEEKKALAFLKDPNLMGRIKQDLAKAGYVGEDINKTIAYLVATSRKLDKPLSCIIVSQSSTGKSQLMEVTASLMPEEDVEFYSRITPQSLYYMGRDQLKHKLLIVDERSGSEEADYSIRNLQTRHKLTLAYPLKDPMSGKTRTVIIEIEGPIAYMESSTRDRLNPENISRSFLLYLDESITQTQRIHQYQLHKRSLSSWQEEKTVKNTIRLHQNVQRLLRPIKVVIEFKDKIKFPYIWMRTRRDHERFLSLIEVITFIHQYQRQIKTDSQGREYIEATVEDYHVAYQLAQTLLCDLFDDMPKPTKQFFTELQGIIRRKSQEARVKSSEFSFNRRDIREWTNLPDHIVKRHMRIIEELEYLHVHKSGKGGTIRYKILPSKTTSDYLGQLSRPEELIVI